MLAEKLHDWTAAPDISILHRMRAAETIDSSSLDIAFIVTMKSYQTVIRFAFLILALILDLIYAQSFSAGSPFMNVYSETLTEFVSFTGIVLIVWAVLFCRDAFGNGAKWHRFCHLMVASQHKEFFNSVSTNKILERCGQAIEKHANVEDESSDAFWLHTLFIQFWHQYPHPTKTLDDWLYYGKNQSPTAVGSLLLLRLFSVTQLIAWALFFVVSIGDVRDQTQAILIALLYYVLVLLYAVCILYQRGRYGISYMVYSVAISQPLAIVCIAGCQFSQLHVWTAVFAIQGIVTVIPPAYFVCWKVPKSREDERNNVAKKDITSKLKTTERLNKQSKKLLLLGTGSSGKSTLLKSLKIITRDQNMDTETTESRHVIRLNCVAGILTILKKSQEIYDEDPEKNKECLVSMDDDIVVAIQLVVNYGGENFAEMLDYEEVGRLGMNMFVWWECVTFDMNMYNRTSNLLSVVVGRSQRDVQATGVHVFVSGQHRLFLRKGAPDHDAELLSFR